MNAKQRKVHFYTWVFLILAVPVLIFFAVKDLSFNSSNEQYLNNSITKGEFAVKSIENDLIKVSIHKNKLTVELKTTVKSASTLLYTIDAEENKDRLLGQITTSGSYTFPIETLPKGIMLYDTLKDELITKLKL